MKKGFIAIFIIISLLFVTGCINDITGETVNIIKDNTGSWLVLTLENTDRGYELIKADTQDYNKNKYQKFKRLLPSPELMNHDSTITIKQMINRNEVIIIESFESKTTIISEKFNSNNSIELIDFKLKNHDILEIKIPIDNKINPSKPIEIEIETPKIKQVIIKTTDFIKWKKIFKKINDNKLTKNRDNNNLITGRVINEDNICSHLKSFTVDSSIHTNDHYNQDRINLVFIGFNQESIQKVTDGIPYLLDLEGKGIESYYIDSETGKKIEIDKTRGIFYFDPLKSNIDKFNFWYIDEIQKAYKTYNKFTNPCKCRDPDINYNKMLIKCGLTNIKVAILCNDVCVSKAPYNGGHLELSTKHNTKNKFFTKDNNELPINPGDMQIISHEWGHLFGGLADEYTTSTNIDQPRYPNCLPNKEIANELLLNLFPDLEYHYGCSYSMSNIKFSESSLMSWALKGDEFNDVSKFYLCYQIFSKSGEVNGDFCDSIFYEEFESPKEICGDGKDNNGNGKTDCQEYVCRLEGCDEFINEYQIQHWDYNKMVSTSEDFQKYCNDNIDNDFNKKIDCEDSICFSENCNEVCNDGQDNNLNGLFDCEDPSCEGTLICDEICGDGIDNNNNQIIDYDHPNYKKCKKQNTELMNNCSMVQLFDKACTDKGGIGDKCITNKDCFWQPSFFEGDSCVNGICKAHPDIYAISPTPKSCKFNIDCDESKKCKKVAYAGTFKSIGCIKNVEKNFNKCIECLDPDCKYTEFCS
jgi:hypothetical protein